MNTTTTMILVLLGLLLSSCNKWLDIQPESEIAASILFSTEEGFQEALIGVYNRSTENGLYGKELTVGTPEVLAQNYSFSSYDPFTYLQTSLYNYNNAEFINRKDAIWIGLYNGIVNCNLILSNIDEKKNIFTGINYSLIKGEALALRAYLHFDALRLFAPSHLNSPSGQGVPYVTTYSKEITGMATVTGVLDSVIKDMELAKQFMAADPIRSASYIIGYPTVTDETLNTEETSNTLFLQNRRHRLNYYAVCATLARVYLYKGEKNNALLNAREVIESNKFPWTSSSDFLAVDENKKDRILYKELVFAWFIPTMATEYASGWFRTETSGMFLQEEAGKSIYETGGVGSNDLRYKQWFNAVNSQTFNVLEILKYRRNTQSTTDDANLHYLMAPAIRLSEMYYIAAECTYANNPVAALDYIDQVRYQRGIGEAMTASNEEDFLSKLINEFRKETYAEGQLFYMYKRLHHAIVGQSGAIIPASNDIFVLPLPDDEIVYGGR